MRWAIADTWTITLRALAHWARQPFVLVVGLAFPILMLLMFAYLLRGGYGAAYPGAAGPGAARARRCVFGLEATMTAIVTDAERGITDRFRSLPMAGSAVVAGRGVADLLNAAVGPGRADGVRAGDRLELARRARRTRSRRSRLLLWLRFAMIWLGLYLGLVAGKPEAVVARADPRLAARLSFQCVQRSRDDAGLARDRRRVEPAVGDGRRDPRAVRQSRAGAVTRGPATHSLELATAVAAGPDRDLLPAGGRALSGAGPVSPRRGPDR